MIAAIVCVDNNFGIGCNGDLLAHIPEDMRFFRDKTKNSIVIMGRKTYDSLPLKPLPYRTNIVITSKVKECCEIDNNGTIFVSMDFIKIFLKTLSPEAPIDYYIIGGGRIYKELLPYCDKAYVTKVNYAYENVDTYFPNIDNDKKWEVEESSEIKIYNGIEYKFYTYKNRGE